MKPVHSTNETSEAIPSYKPRAGFLTSQEIALYNTLHEIFDDNNEVLVKVSLAKLVAIPGADRRYLAHWRRVQRRSLDFLICSSCPIVPVLAIKMETEAESKKRRERGQDIVDTVLKDIGLPLLRLRARDKHKAKDLAKQISFLLEETIETRPANHSNPVGSIWTSTKKKCGLGARPVK